ncbi:type I secretion system permease/ATPase [Sphingomonas ginsenosidivorax]|uniref:Type I secretion system permease/ATPase n=1 Tax=Sphingomonas ginsenosidivorax TaxID=862135 RepID=A0A5C6UAK4_9SPHN|nr:type I secretion system permease/ATPase [Sphingomonas ginsenosidivorax]
MFAAKEPFSNQAWSLIRSHVRWAVLFSALVNILYLAPTIYMIQVYDRVVPTRGVLTLVFITLVILGALATLSVLDQMRNAILLRAAIRLDDEIGPRLVRMTVSTPAAGGHPQQVMRDFDTLRQFLASPALGALFDMPWAPIYIIVATIIHPLLGLATLIGAAILVALAIANDRATRAAAKAAAERSTDTYFAQEAVGSVTDTIRALGMRDALVNQFVASRVQSAAPGRAVAETASRYSGVIKFARLSLQSAALGIGAFLAINDMISAGAIISASVLMSRALGPIDQIVSGWRGLGDARNALAKLNEFTLNYAEPGPRTALPRPRPVLQVENVSVLAPDGKRLLIADISFAVDKPAIVAVVGPSGAGKSTLLQVMANARVADRGAVRLDSAKHTDWEPEQLAGHLGYLPQDITLLSGSIKDNISRFQSRLGDDIDAAAVAAAQRAGAHDMILHLPAGYDTMLGPRGRGLSAGQQQRVGLARALYGSPVMLVLDEPYSALDNESEARLLRGLAEMREQGTIVVVAAHKNSIVKLSDYLVIMKDGALQAFGPTAKILEQMRPAPVPRSEVATIA